MKYIIYKTTNLKNGKFYIGRHKTKNLDDGYIGSGRHFLNAVSKYGKENFVREILLHCENEAQMHLAEKILVVLDSEMSYNIARGGKEGGFDYLNANKLNGKYKFTAEQRRLGGKNKLHTAPENFLKAAKTSFLGRKHSEETLAKMRASHQKRITLQTS